MGTLRTISAVSVCRRKIPRTTVVQISHFPPPSHATARLSDRRQKTGHAAENIPPAHRPLRPARTLVGSSVSVVRQNAPSPRTPTFEAEEVRGLCDRFRRCVSAGNEYL